MVDKSTMIENLTEAELNQTVEEFLAVQSKNRAASIKRQVEEMTTKFTEDAKRARKALLDVVASQQSSATDEAAGSESAPALQKEETLSDAFDYSIQLGLG